MDNFNFKTMTTEIPERSTINELVVMCDLSRPMITRHIVRGGCLKGKDGKYVTADVLEEIKRSQQRKGNPNKPKPVNDTKEKGQQLKNEKLELEIAVLRKINVPRQLMKDTIQAHASFVKRTLESLPKGVAAITYDINVVRLIESKVQEIMNFLDEGVA